LHFSGDSAVSLLSHHGIKARVVVKNLTQTNPPVFLKALKKTTIKPTKKKQ